MDDIAWQAEEGKGEHYEPEIEDLRAEIIFIETSDFFKKSCSVSIDKVIDNGHYIGSWNCFYFLAGWT